MEEGSQSLERPPTEEEGEMGHHFFTLPYYHRCSCTFKKLKLVLGKAE